MVNTLVLHEVIQCAVIYQLPDLLFRPIALLVGENLFWFLTLQSNRALNFVFKPSFLTHSLLVLPNLLLRRGGSVVLKHNGVPSVSSRPRFVVDLNGKLQDLPRRVDLCVHMHVFVPNGACRCAHSLVCVYAPIDELLHASGHARANMRTGANERESLSALGLRVTRHYWMSEPKRQ